MPHRNRTLMMVVSLIWIVALLGTFLSARVGAGGGQQGDGNGHEHSHSSLLLVKAPAPPMANHSADIDLTAPGRALA